MSKINLSNYVYYYHHISDNPYTRFQYRENDVDILNIWAYYNLYDIE